MLAIFRNTSVMPPLPEPHRYVHTLMFEGIEDPFDAQKVWTRQSRFTALFLRDDRLKAALRDHTTLAGRGQQKVYAHIELGLPLALMEDDRRITGGARAQALAQELSEQHKHDYSRQLMGVTPRYTVRGIPGLSHGCVQVRFGEGIYVPEANEKPAWHVETSLDGGIIWQKSAELYDNSRLIVLGAETNNSSARIQDWSFPEITLVIMGNGDELELSAEPFGTLDISFNPETGIHTICAANHETGNASPLLLRAQRQRSPTPKIIRPTKVSSNNSRSIYLTDGPEDRIEPRSTTTQTLPEDDEESATYFPVLSSSAQQADDGSLDETLNGSGTIFFAPPAQIIQHSLTLAGLALPRPRHCGADGAIEIHLNSQASVVDIKQAALSVGITLDDQPYVRTQRGHRPLEMEERLPLGSGHLQILRPPPELPDLAALILFDPPPASSPLPPERKGFFGRKSIAASNLRVLKGHAIRAQGKSTDWERLGFSGEHFAFQPKPEGLLVSSFARSPLGHLNSELQTLQIHAADGEFSVCPGDLLIAGCYVLRYHMN